MPDTTIFNIDAGIRQTWAAIPELVALVPTERLYMFEAPDGATQVYTTYEFEDISAFFGGTEYFSGRDYVKQTRIIFTTYGPRTFDWTTFSQVMSNSFGCSMESVAGRWDIPNCIVLYAQPETENESVFPGETQGVIVYRSSFTLTMQADRG